MRTFVISPQALQKPCMSDSFTEWISSSLTNAQTQSSNAHDRWVRVRRCHKTTRVVWHNINLGWMVTELQRANDHQYHSSNIVCYPPLRPSIHWLHVQAVAWMPAVNGQIIKCLSLYLIKRLKGITLGMRCFVCLHCDMWLNKTCYTLYYSNFYYYTLYLLISWWFETDHRK